ncbi:DUF4291 domain-containing protein [Pseudoalteromonas sp. SMS1]|uniref:DUF4291 domain-containing protein n=1 Tax=Pseudoalteromonas sp. SMS1 TaxID=2908894 RepID=UPI001F23A071|nr:DUF4291 domain-containing protein [Pseudoalteromonas sp. SMS1]MCF2859156.1 DUF4291 domain-containing protein [Pseudoalteromonas sp. SMS1]
MTFPNRQIRAVYDKQTIRVYQAYNDAIANSTLAHGTFISPPFKMERMTWIKPSFLWMMYRSGWAQKDAGQNRILAIDISREGFEWALNHSLLSHQAKEFTDKAAWLKLKNSTPVRIQWDPERDIFLQPLAHRAIQIGLSSEAVDLYVHQWVQNVTDVTELATTIKGHIDNHQLESAKALLPNEVPYPLCTVLKDKIMAE